MFSKLSATVDHYTPSMAEPNPATIPDAILNHAFILDFQSVLGSSIQQSSDMNDRLFHGHGHTLEEIWKLRTGGKFDRLPDWVVWPRMHSDVEKIVRLAVKHNVCLIPFGGGTSVTWALLCPTNEKRMIVSVDTSQMNKILYLDEKNLTARIQSGIIGQDLERELGKKGSVRFNRWALPCSLLLDSRLLYWPRTGQYGVQFVGRLGSNSSVRNEKECLRQHRRSRRSRDLGHRQRNHGEELPGTATIDRTGHQSLHHGLGRHPGSHNGSDHEDSTVARLQEVRLDCLPGF